METKKPALGPANRLEMGDAILAAARMVDTKVITPRVTAFSNAHRSYSVAQRKVETVEGQLREAQAKLVLCDAEQDETVDGLTRALIYEGQPRGNPFAAFGISPPSLVKKLPYPDEVKTIHQLVAAVQRCKTVSQASRGAARAAQQAAQSMEAGLLPIAKLEANLRRARHERDTVGQSWDTALAGLRRGARAAIDDGAPGLYTALFGRFVRTSRKNGKHPPTSGSAPAPASAQTPAGTA